jgi:uncharacterized protein DUF6916
MSAPTTFTRRSLLRAGAIAVTLVGLRPPASASAAAAPGHLLRSSYAGREGQRFLVGSVELRLVSVTDLAGASADRSLRGSEDAFALTFSDPLDAALEAGTHTVRHPDLGRFELFVAPVERPRSDRRYEAVVDRSTPHSSGTRTKYPRRAR